MAILFCPVPDIKRIKYRIDKFFYVDNKLEYMKQQQLNTTQKLSTEILYLQKEFKKEFKEILNFWEDKTQDHMYGGFIGRMDFYGEVDSLADKGIILNARILWTFSAAYRILNEEKYKNLADRAYHYLITKFWDKREGGFVWSLSYDGKVKNDRKQTYAQAFGLYALAEYYRSIKNEDAIEYARQIYFIIENKLWDYEFGGYLEALTRDWSIMQDMRLSEKDANLPKSMNTHLHILESYTCLYRVWPDHQLKSSIISLLDIFHDKIMDANSEHFNLFFDYEWNLKSDIVSYGHDIEGAWLMHEAADVIGDTIYIDKIQKVAVQLVDATISQGLDKDGSVFNEKEGLHLDVDKHWWPQAEAMVGLFDAWEITGKLSYLNKIEPIWVFIKDKLIDKKRGEWFWSVDADGIPYTTDDKVGPWKCPYHNSRAMMELYERINKYKG